MLIGSKKKEEKGKEEKVSARKRKIVAIVIDRRLVFSKVKLFLKLHLRYATFSTFVQWDGIGWRSIEYADSEILSISPLL